MVAQRQQPTRRRFTVEEYLALEAAELPALGCRLALADPYEGVALPDESA